VQTPVLPAAQPHPPDVVAAHAKAPL